MMTTSEPNPDTIDEDHEVLRDIAKIVTSCNARMGHLLHGADLDDAIQETSLRVWKARDSFRGDSLPATWVYGIARFAILGAFRELQDRASRRTALGAVQPDLTDDATLPGELSRTGFWRTLHASIQREGTTVASIILSHHIDGLSLSKTSKRLGLHLEAVKSKYRRCLPRLRQRLRRFGPREPE